MNIQEIISEVEQKVFNEINLSLTDMRPLINIESLVDLQRLFQSANKTREIFRGKRVDLCSITNAKSGNCSENCIFCAQSAHNKTTVSTYPLVSVDEMVSNARKAFGKGTKRFCIVTSGCSVNNQEFDSICEAIKIIKEKFPTLKMDASLGKLTKEKAFKLKDAGLDRYNHNIETAESFFSSVCTTHSFNDRIETLKILKEVGIERCCGGIFGLGESSEQRINMAFYLRDLDVDCVPINFLNPIKGTPAENNKIPEPLELLKWVALFRLILPNKQIRICGGRQKNLRQLQSLIFFAGADAIIMGDYLTTKGSEPHQDIQMIFDSGLTV